MSAHDDVPPAQSPEDTPAKVGGRPRIFGLPPGPRVPHRPRQSQRTPSSGQNAGWWPMTARCKRQEQSGPAMGPATGVTDARDYAELDVEPDWRAVVIHYRGPLRQDEALTRVAEVAAADAAEWDWAYVGRWRMLTVVVKADTLKVEGPPQVEVPPLGSMVWGKRQAEDIADAIAYIVTRPRHVAINELLIRPTEQEQ